MSSFDTQHDGGDHGYTDGASFVQLLGRESRARMLDVFLGKHYTELTQADVADLSGLDPATVSRNIEVFVDLGVIEPTRAVGTSQLYSVNTDADLVKALGKARDELRQHAQTLNEQS